MLAFINQEFNCNGTVVEHPEYGEVIQLQGDKRDATKNFLVEVGIATADQVKVRPFLLLYFSLCLSYILTFLFLVPTYYIDLFSTVSC